MGGQERLKSAPEWPEFGFWAVQRLPKLVNEPWSRPKWFPQLPLIDLRPFPDRLKHCSHYILKKYQFYYIVKIFNFWHFNFNRFSWPTESIFERFRNFPHPTTCWWGVENYKTFQKVPQLAMKLAKVTCIFFTEFWVKNFETFWNFHKSFWWPKKPWNHPKTIHTWFPQLTRPPKNMFFCPKRGHICQIDQIGKGRETL